MYRPVTAFPCFEFFPVFSGEIVVGRLDCRKEAHYIHMVLIQTSCHFEKAPPYPHKSTGNPAPTLRGKFALRYSLAALEVAVCAGALTGARGYGRSQIRR